MTSARREPAGLSGEIFHGAFRPHAPLPEDARLALLNFVMQEFGLQQPVVLKGPACAFTLQFLVEQHERQHSCADLLYLDAAALRDNSTWMSRLCGLLSRKGLICVESDAAAGVVDAGMLPGVQTEVVLSRPGFAIFARADGERSLRSMRYQVDLFLRRRHVEQACRLRAAARPALPEVAVIVPAYQHEDYIAECLRSVLSQRGRFRLHVIVIDDASSDRTAEVIRTVMAENPDGPARIDFHANARNGGMVATLAMGMRLAAGHDYVTFCEGDDFWSSGQRIQAHIDFLHERPDAVMSFNTLELCAADGSSRSVNPAHASLATDSVDGHQLAASNVIGNFSACFYRGELVDVIPQEIFQRYTADWLVNLYCAQFGRLAHLKQSLSVYRQHGGSTWSSLRSLDKARALLGLIPDYNAFLDYSFDEGLQRYRKSLYDLLDAQLAEGGEDLDLIILDDIFPAAKSVFRHVEFTAYLREFPASLVLTSGLALPVVEETPLKDVIRSYQRLHPELSSQVLVHTGPFPLRLAKLIYVVFLHNVHAMLADIEAARVPFVFTLYPGGGFVRNSPECDRKLRRVFASPCFQKVIVTQNVTRDYIVQRGLCPAGKVQMIFGVVMPPDMPAESSLPTKRRWGFGKPRLDICFMAHKYTRYGEDKGYDIFVQVASMLCQRHNDIHFHVMGPFDRRVIDVSSFSDRITFHGSLNPEAFDGFFQDMDLILSPNISGKIFPGSFDGFPTASCTEAGLRGVAIFATDEFNSAEGRYRDGEDIVLVPHDAMAIVDSIEHHYAEPGTLKAIGECGARRIRTLYDVEAQLRPRIDLLREVMRDAVVPPYELMPVEADGAAYPDSRVWAMLRSICPYPLKRAWRAWRLVHADR